MKFIFVMSILAFLLIAGCTTAPESKPEAQNPQPPKNQTCRTVTEQVPVVAEECGEVAYTEQVCDIRKLNFTQTSLTKVDLCISDSVCMGKPLVECPNCVKAMTRCVLQIRNTETEKTGTWTVGANYTMGNFGFDKDPISHSIKPGESADFDFNQIYTLAYPVSSANCDLRITSVPTIEECVGHTRTTTECKNVTKTEAVSKEVCQ